MGRSISPYFLILILVSIRTTIPLVSTHLQIDIPSDDGYAFHKLSLLLQGSKCMDLNTLSYKKTTTHPRKSNLL